MAYTTSDEIAAEIKGMTFGATGNVLASSVTQFIAESDALINSYVGTIYSVPVSVSGDGLTLLKLLSRSLVVQRVKKIMEVKSAKAGDADQNVTTVLLTTAQVMKILTDIQAKNLILAGATLLNAGGGFYNSNVANSVCPTIKKDDKQW